MCTHTIIDTNVFGKIGSAQMKSLLDWVKHGHGILVYTNGGKYREELRASTETYARFRAYRQSGRAELVEWDRVQNQESLAGATLRSDDSHVIALARASETLMLCTSDEALKMDFLNRELLPDVNGRRRAVYPLRSTGRQPDFTQVRVAWPDDTITAAELLSRLDRGPAPFTAADLDAIDRSKAEQQVPEDKWNDL